MVFVFYSDLQLCVGSCHGSTHKLLYYSSADFTRSRENGAADLWLKLDVVISALLHLCVEPWHDPTQN